MAYAGATTGHLGGANLYAPKSSCSCAQPLVYVDVDGDRSCYRCGHQLIARARRALVDHRRLGRPR